MAAAATVVAENDMHLRVRPIGMIKMTAAHRHALGLVQSLWTIPATTMTCGTWRAPARRSWTSRTIITWIVVSLTQVVTRG